MFHLQMFPETWCVADVLTFFFFFQTKRGTIFYKMWVFCSDFNSSELPGPLALLGQLPWNKLHERPAMDFPPVISVTPAFTTPHNLCLIFAVVALFLFWSHFSDCLCFSLHLDFKCRNHFFTRTLGEDIWPLTPAFAWLSAVPFFPVSAWFWSHCLICFGFVCLCWTPTCCQS